MTKPKPKFCLSKAKNAKFETFYRDYFEIRDLGLSEATHGIYDGFVTRVKELGGKRGRHYHKHDFQIMFVIKGLVKMWNESEGECVMEQGDFCYLPPKHVHDLLDYSEDVELFELFSPKSRAAINV